MALLINQAFKIKCLFIFYFCFFQLTCCGQPVHVTVLQKGGPVLCFLLYSFDLWCFCVLCNDGRKKDSFLSLKWQERKSNNRGRLCGAAPLSLVTSVSVAVCCQGNRERPMTLSLCGLLLQSIIFSGPLWKCSHFDRRQAVSAHTKCCRRQLQSVIQAAI